MCDEPIQPQTADHCPNLARANHCERADEYEAYNYEVGIKPLSKKALGVQTLREDRENETEFMTISYWESVEAMSKFTGGDPREVRVRGANRAGFPSLQSSNVQGRREIRGSGSVCALWVSETLACEAVEYSRGGARGITREARSQSQMTPIM